MWASVLVDELPIDGDPGEIKAQWSYYYSVTESVRRTIDSLGQVTDGLQTQSDAVTAFAEIATEVQADLKLVEIRYTTFVDQLDVYQRELRRLQDEAAAIRAAAKLAEGDYNWNTWRAADEHTKAMYPDYSDPDYVQKVTEALELEKYYERHANEAKAIIDARQADLESLLTEWRGIADGCADQIAGALEESGLKDGWWETFTGWVERTLPNIEMWLDILAVVLTIAAFLAVLTGVGAFLAPALFAIARGIQVLSKIIKVVKILTTVVQVVRREKPPTALIQFAVDAAIDKVGGKLLDGLGKKAMGGLKHALGDKILKSEKGGVLMGNLKEIAENGFDSWVNGTFTDAVLPGVKMGEDGVSPQDWFGTHVEAGLDAVLNPLDKAGDAGVNFVADLALGPESGGVYANALLNTFAGPDTLLSGLAGDTLNLFESPWTDASFAEIPKPNADGLPFIGDDFLKLFEPHRPTYDQIVSAS